jgi:hypothetical protein
VITDIAVERVEFRCPDSHWQSVVDYDVVVYVDADGATWEFFSVNGVLTPSPYTIDGAPLCPVCHRAVPGNPVAALHPSTAWRRPRTTTARLRSENTSGRAAPGAVAVRHVNPLPQPVR